MPRKSVNREATICSSDSEEYICIPLSSLCSPEASSSSQNTRTPTRQNSKPTSQRKRSSSKSSSKSSSQKDSSSVSSKSTRSRLKQAPAKYSQKDASYGATSSKSTRSRPKRAAAKDTQRDASYEPTSSKSTRGRPRRAAANSATKQISEMASNEATLQRPFNTRTRKRSTTPKKNRSASSAKKQRKSPVSKTMDICQSICSDDSAGEMDYDNRYVVNTASDSHADDSIEVQFYDNEFNECMCGDEAGEYLYCEERPCSDEEEQLSYAEDSSNYHRGICKPSQENDTYNGSVVRRERNDSMTNSVDSFTTSYEEDGNFGCPGGVCTNGYDACQSPVSTRYSDTGCTPCAAPSHQQVPDYSDRDPFDTASVSSVNSYVTLDNDDQQSVISAFSPRNSMSNSFRDCVIPAEDDKEALMQLGAAFADELVNDLRAQVS